MPADAQLGDPGRVDVRRPGRPRTRHAHTDQAERQQATEAPSHRPPRFAPLPRRPGPAQHDERREQRQPVAGQPVPVSHRGPREDRDRGGADHHDDEVGLHVAGLREAQQAAEPTCGRAGAVGVPVDDVAVAGPHHQRQPADRPDQARRTGRSTGGCGSRGAATATWPPGPPDEQHGDRTAGDHRRHHDRLGDVEELLVAAGPSSRGASDHQAAERRSARRGVERHPHRRRRVVHVGLRVGPVPEEDQQPGAQGVGDGQRRGQHHRAEQQPGHPRPHQPAVQAPSRRRATTASLVKKPTIGTTPASAAEADRHGHEGVRAAGCAARPSRPSRSRRRRRARPTRPRGTAAP